MAHLDSNIDNVVDFALHRDCRPSLLIVGTWSYTAVLVHVTIRVTLLVAGETKQSQHLDFPTVEAEIRRSPLSDPKRNEEPARPPTAMATGIERQSGSSPSLRGLCGTNVKHDIPYVVIPYSFSTSGERAGGGSMQV